MEIIGAYGDKDDGSIDYTYKGWIFFEKPHGKGIKKWNIIINYLVVMKKIKDVFVGF